MRRPMNRRRFLQLGTNALASSGLLATLGGFERALAASDTSGYRALVCIYLFGGNDSFNLLVPRSTAAYNQYANTRRNLAVDRDKLLAIHPRTGDGNQYGLHPSCPELQHLFENGNLSFVANVGALVEPVTRAQIRTGTAVLPLQLFSHEDQNVQWMTGRSDSTERRGWAGRIADLLADQGYAPELSMNISVAGSNIWQSAGNVVPYRLSLGGAPELGIVAGDARTDTYLELLRQAGSDPSIYTQQFAETEQRALDVGHSLNQALASVAPFQTKFPNTDLGRQLGMVAKVIGARAQLAAQRQIFFVQLPAFDTHDNQLAQHPDLLAMLSKAMRAFHAATVELGVQSSVTTFTASEFGRTLTSNGDGTDHAWGAHHMVMGGAVRGQNIFGRMPELVLGGPDDTDMGRVIPSQAMDQYAATLARWFGVSESDLDLVFPNLQNFESRDLGFMG